MTMRTALMAVLASSVAGCGGGLPPVDLEPAPHQAQIAGERDTAVESVFGVRIEAVTNTWSADVERPRELVPVLLRVHNGSPTAIRVAYDQVALIDAAGRRYAPVAPADFADRLEDPQDASELAMSALPALDVAVGEHAEGFLYFGPVDPRVPDVTLQLQLVAAGTEQRFGVATLAFDVDPR